MVKTDNGFPSIVLGLRVSLSLLVFLPGPRLSLRRAKHLSLLLCFCTHPTLGTYLPTPLP